MSQGDAGREKMVNQLLSFGADVAGHGGGVITVRHGVGPAVGETHTAGDVQVARRRGRFRLDQAEGCHRLVGVGPCPHLLPDRHAQPLRRGLELAMDLRLRPALGTPDHPEGDAEGRERPIR